MLNLDLDEISDSEIQLNLLPQPLIEQYFVLPLSDERVVIAEPDNLTLLQEINFHLDYLPILYLADKEKLQKKIASLLHHQEKENLLNDDEASIVQYVEKLFVDAVSKKASDIHLETDQKNLHIRFRIDGILYEIAKLAKHFAARIITHLKVLAQLDITEKRLPQDGRLRMLSYDCRISTCPMIHEEKIVLRLLNIKTQPLEINSLGFSDDQKAIFLSTLQKPQGMILVTGPTGSGKTVTLYTALNLLNKTHVNISSVEDPVEIELSGINQVQVNNKIDLSFSKVLRAFLRQDPDIIMIGEMRDKETADIAIKAAQTGHLVLSTLHTNSAAETLTRLINMGIPTYDIAASISLIIAQRLIRCLCKYCQGKVCSKCQKGYLGRTAIYEFLTITPDITELILKNQSIKSHQHQTLYDHGIEKVNAGITTLAELSRVLQC